MFVIAVYCPVAQVEDIKFAMFRAGAGKVGHYEACCFEYSGVGQFRATDGAQPFVGKVGEIEKVKEVKIEMVCEEEYLSQVISAMRSAHPYEEPAFHVLKNYSAQFES